MDVRRMFESSSDGSLVVSGPNAEWLLLARGLLSLPSLFELDEAGREQAGLVAKKLQARTTQANTNHSDVVVEHSDLAYLDAAAYAGVTCAKTMLETAAEEIDRDHDADVWQSQIHFSQLDLEFTQAMGDRLAASCTEFGVERLVARELATVSLT